MYMGGSLKGRHKNVSKGEEKSQLSPRVFPRSVGLLSGAFSIVDLMVSNYITRDVMIFIG